MRCRMSGLRHFSRRSSASGVHSYGERSGREKGGASPTETAGGNRGRGALYLCVPRRDEAVKAGVFESPRPSLCLLEFRHMLIRELNLEHARSIQNGAGPREKSNSSESLRASVNLKKNANELALNSLSVSSPKRRRSKTLISWLREPSTLM